MAIEETMAKLDQVFKMRGQRSASVDDVVTQLRERNKDLQVELHHVGKEYNNLVHQYEAEVGSYQTQLDSIQQTNREQVFELKEQINSLNAHLFAMEKEANAAKAELEDVLAQKELLEKRIEESNKRQDEMQEVLSTLQLGVEDRVKKTASEAERLIHQANSRHEVEKRRMTAQIREAQALCEDVRLDAERHVEEYRSKFEVERRKNDEIIRERDFMRQENDRLNAIVNSIQGTVDQLLTEEMRIAGSIDLLKSDITPQITISELEDEDTDVGFIDLSASIAKAAVN